MTDLAKTRARFEQFTFRSEQLAQASCTDSLNSALFRATLKDLPNLRSPGDWKNKIVQEGPGLLVKVGHDWSSRRPLQSEVEVSLFKQTITPPERSKGDMEDWLSIDVNGGCVLRPKLVEAYAAVVTHLAFSAVYFGSLPLSYMINRRIISDSGLKRFEFDLKNRQLASPCEAGRYE